MDYSLFDFIGNVGVILLLGTYFLLQMGRLHSARPLYSWLNLLASGMLCISLVRDFNLSAFIIQFCWALISIYGIYRARRRA